MTLPPPSTMPAPTVHGLPEDARVLRLFVSQPAGTTVPLKPWLNEPSARTCVADAASTRPTTAEATGENDFMSMIRCKLKGCGALRRKGDGTRAETLTAQQARALVA